LKPTKNLSIDNSKPNQDDFSTNHLLSNLTHKTVSSSFISLGTQGAKFLLNLMSTIILARLLMPEDFGIVAMVMSVSGFFMMLKDAGLSTVVIQKDLITHEQVSNLFWLNIIFSTGLSLTMATIAYPVSWFYKEPRLVNITLALSIIFFIFGSSFQHQALLKRQLKFKTIAAIEIGSMASGFITGVFMALHGYKYWSLIGQNIALALMTCLLTWYFSNWRPSFFTRNCGTIPLLNFGINLTGASLLQAISRMLEYFLIGRFYGAQALGIYSRANALLMNPLQQLLSPLSNVFIPVLSRLQTDEKRYRNIFLQIYETMAILIFPASGLLMIISDPLINIVLGPKWHEAAPIFTLFTILAIYAPLSGATIWLFTSQGRGNDLIRTTTIITFFGICSIIVGLPFGAKGVAFSYSLTGIFIRLPILYYLAGRKGPVSTTDLFVKFVKHLPLWFGVVGSTYITNILIPTHEPIHQIFISTFVGVIVSIFLIYNIKHEREIAINLINKMFTLIPNKFIVK